MFGKERVLPFILELEASTMPVCRNGISESLEFNTFLSPSMKELVRFLGKEY